MRLYGRSLCTPGLNIADTTFLASDILSLYNAKKPTLRIEQYFIISFM